MNFIFEKKNKLLLSIYWVYERTPVIKAAMCYLTQPSTGNGDISIWVKNSEEGCKTPNKKTNNGWTSSVYYLETYKPIIKTGRDLLIVLTKLVLKMEIEIYQF